MNNIEKKEIPETTAVNAFIKGFISYGIIFGFITLIIIAFFKWVLQNSTITENLTFTIITSILKAIIFYFLILFVCRITTFDVLKKCKINKDSIKCILSKMKVFFILCGVLSIMSCAVKVSAQYLNLNNNLYLVSTDNYSAFKDYNKNIATDLNKIETQKMKTDWFRYKVSTSITEISILISFIYLISYQKKMILLYNKAE